MKPKKAFWKTMFGAATESPAVQTATEGDPTATEAAEGTDAAGLQLKAMEAQIAALKAELVSAQSGAEDKLVSECNAWAASLVKSEAIAAYEANSYAAAAYALKEICAAAIEAGHAEAVSIPVAFTAGEEPKTVALSEFFSYVAQGKDAKGEKTVASAWKNSFAAAKSDTASTLSVPEKAPVKTGNFSDEFIKDMVSGKLSGEQIMAEYQKVGKA